MSSNREGSQTNFELPPASSPEEVVSSERQETPAPRPETTGNQPAPPAPSTTLPAVPDIPDQPVVAISADDDSAAATPVPVDPKAIARDTDRIESEWVEKAKAVIARTHDDPYVQKNEMSKVKAEYIQKRFNKTIKTDGTAPA